MDLRNQKITVGELLDDPRSRGVLTRRFPFVFKKQFPRAARTVTLEQLIALVGGFLPPRKVEDTLAELKGL